MTQGIEIKGLNELLRQMTKYPMQLVKVVSVTMSASLNTLWEKVPAYPPQEPDATYRRTGTLGKSLGSSMSGGAVGDPSVYRIRQLGEGEGNFEGTFGSNLDYAPFVIGEQQAGMHSSNWWNIITIAQRAADKIERLWQKAGDLLAEFLEKQGA